jgi:16S rRNA (cytosine967-C5)-methyltransferase
VREGSPFSTLAFERGLFYVQDEASQAAALVPPPRPGERVLDAAASPGGKGLALLAAEPAVRLVAADLSVGRLALLGENSRRLVRRVARVAADAAASPFAAAFDRVVLDFPCSGTGTLRKNPELKWRWSESEVERLAEQALRLLTGAARAVAPGGLLVAISCSLEPEENEALAAPLLAAVPDLAPEPLEAALDGPLRGGVVAPGLWRMPTDGEHDGFTVQVFRRRSRAGG